MIECECLRFHYGNHQALKGVSLSVAPGEAVGLVGDNGAGKTTLLRVLAGILRPSAGRAAIDGHDVDAAGLDARRRLAFVPDEPPLLPGLTVLEHARFVAQVHGVTDARAGEVLEEAGLDDRKSQRSTTLSRGLRQRLALAMASIHRPAAILLDEPFNGLDPSSRAALSAWIDLRRDAGAAILVSSHDLALLERSCSRYVVMRSGRVAADLRASDLHGTATASIEELLAGQGGRRNEAVGGKGRPA